MESAGHGETGVLRVAFDYESMPLTETPVLKAQFGVLRLFILLAIGWRKKVSGLNRFEGLKEGLDHRGVTPGRIGCGGHCEGRNESIDILFRWGYSFMYIDQLMSYNRGNWG